MLKMAFASFPRLPWLTRRSSFGSKKGLRCGLYVHCSIAPHSSSQPHHHSNGQGKPAVQIAALRQRHLLLVRHDRRGCVRTMPSASKRHRSVNLYTSAVMHRHDFKLDGHGLVQRVVSPSRVTITCGREEYAYRTCDASNAEAELLLQCPTF